MNKGVIAKVVPEEEMPTDANGKPLEIFINPNGVIGRMNPGQILEMYTGKLIKHVNDKCKMYLNDNQTQSVIPEIIKMHELILGSTHKTVKLIKDNFSKMKPADKQAFYDNLRKESVNISVFFDPMIPVKISNLEKAYEYYNIKQKEQLFDPVLGKKTTTPVGTGYVYWSKVKHTAKKGIHGRSTGKVQSGTGQATQGKANEGGQRVGELDFYQLISYEAFDYVQEISSVGSDDLGAKNSVVSKIYNDGYASLSDAKHATQSNSESLFTILMVCKGVMDPLELKRIKT